MDKITSVDDFRQAKTRAIAALAQREKQKRYQINVSVASCSIAAGALETLATIKSWVSSHDLKDVYIKQVGCLGLCSIEPVVEVLEANRPPVIYGKVTPDVANRIFQQHIEKGLIVHEHVVEIA